MKLRNHQFGVGNTLLISQKNALLKKNIPSEAGNFGLMPKDVSVDSPVSGVAKTARLALF